VAYTVVIAAVSGNYSFDVQPMLRPSYSYEENRAVVPYVRTAEIETWTLDGAAYRSTAQADITDDFDALRDLVASRSNPIASVTFYRDSTPVRSISTSTHKGGVFAQALTVDGSPGLWATHWKGTLVVYGRRLLGDGDNIVEMARSLEYRGDPSGLLTITSRGTLSTIPGTSARAKALAAALTDAPTGAAYGLMDGDENGEPTASSLDATDTRASWSATWQEHGESLPAGVNAWTHRVRTTEDPKDGRRTIISVSARGPAIAPLRTAVRALKPSEGLENFEEDEDPVGLSFAATYTTRQASREPDAEVSAGLFYRRMEVEIQGVAHGSDRDSTVFLVPGYTPWLVPKPRQPIVITERLVAKFRGSPSGPSAFGIGSRVKELTGVVFQPGASRAPTVRLEDPGLRASARVWSAEATYVYFAEEADGDRLAGLVAEMTR